MQQHHALLAVTSVAIVAWYAVGMALFVPAAPTGGPLSAQSVLALLVVSWTLFATTLFTNIAWCVRLRMEPEPERRRLCDGAWRTDVLLRLALAIAIFSVVIAVFFTDADSGLFEIDFADRLLLTPLTHFEALLCPVVLGPLYMFLFLFAAVGRSRGNAIKIRTL